MRLRRRRSPAGERQEAAIVDRLNAIVADVGTRTPQGHIDLPWMTSDARPHEALRPVALPLARSTYLSPEDDHGSAPVRDSRVG